MLPIGKNEPSDQPVKSLPREEVLGETPWKSGFFRDKKLRLIRDAAGNIHAQVLSKHFFTPKDGKIISDKIFTHVNEKKLNLEKEKLNNLKGLKFSISELLKQLETDFGADLPPTANAQPKADHDAASSDIEQIKKA